MIIHSDWHIHTDSSYDAHLPLETLIKRAGEQDLRGFGVTDHANFNDPPFLSDLKNSAESVKRLQHTCPTMVAGVELTPIAKPHFDYIAKNGTREGFILPDDRLYPIELAVTKDELRALGIRYAVCAAHWRLDPIHSKENPMDMDSTVREWHRHQMWMACDERTTILGHPWYHGRSLWYEDFSVIPASMHHEFAAALKENHKFAECNVHFFVAETAGDKFRHQYAEFLRYLFESGVRITYGSDCHGGTEHDYPDVRAKAEYYLEKAGFKDGDFSDLTEADLW